MFLGGTHQRQRIFREAGPAIARTRMQELLADTAIQTDATRNVMHICTNFFTQIGNLIDEGDLGCQEGVGGIFDHFRCFTRGENNRRFNQIQRTIKIGHDFARPLVTCTDDNAVRAHEIANRRAFTQEFRIGNHGKIGIRALFTDNTFHFTSGPDRHRRFGNDHGKAVHCLGDFFGRGINIAQIGMAITTTGRSPDGDEHRISILHTFFKIGGKSQAPCFYVIFDQNIQTGLVDWHDTVFKTGDFFHILVDTNHVCTELGETGTGNKSNISGPDHCYAHGCLFPI